MHHHGRVRPIVRGQDSNLCTSLSGLLWPLSYRANYRSPPGLASHRTLLQ